MRLKLSFFFVILNIFLFSQTLTEVPLVYDTSGYRENLDIANTVSFDPLAPTVNAEMNVNESGALTYVLPIEVLKGINSFQPNISLVYNSQSGNGQAGWGWNIVGLSMINRGGTSKEIDGFTRGPQFNDSDPFYLDGQRLLKRNDAEYVTHIFSKIKITRQTSGEFQFIVKYTDGRIAKYKELVTGQYYISTMIDAQNNEIHYSYDVADFVPVLTKISYGGTSVSTDKFYVNFLYKTRKYPIKIFRNEIEYINSKVLHEIRTGSVYNNLYRKYSFIHDFISEDSVERISEINVFNNSGQVLKPLVFKYNIANAAKITIGQGPNGYPLDIAYFNDPRPGDIMGLGSAAVGNFRGKSLEAIYQVKKRNGTYGVINSSIGRSIPMDTNSTTNFYSGKILSKNNKIKDNDQVITLKVNYLDNANVQNENDPVNNNLRDELSFVTRDLISGEEISLKFILRGGLISRENFHAPEDPYVDPDGGIPHNPSLIYRRDTSERTFVSGDFNNDGLIDFLVYEPENYNRPANIYFVEVGKNTPQAANYHYPVSLSGNLNLENKDVYPIEMDGDGISELMVVTKYTWKFDVYKINFQQNSLSAILTNQTLSNFGSDTPIYFGDFNGDGLTDFLTPQKIYDIPKDDDNAGYKIGQIFSSIEKDPHLYWWKYTSDGKKFNQVQEDYKDQKIFYLKPSQNNVIKKSSFWQKFWDGKPDEYAYTRFATQNIIITDFDGDGRSDIMTLNKVGQTKYDSDGRLAGAKPENLDNSFRFIPNFKCVNPNYPFNVVNYVVEASHCASPLVAQYVDPWESATHITSFNSNISNQVNLYLNKNLQGCTFEKKESTSIANVVISPISLVMSNTDFNRLNVYKSGFFIHDPVARLDTKITVNNEGFLETQIQEVDNSSTVIQKVEYRNMAPALDPTLLAQWGIERDYYEELTYISNPQSELTYPYYTHSINGSFYMVNKVHTLFDGKILTKEYRYENGIQNLEGKGFLGFQKTYVSDAYESVIRNNRYSVKNPVNAVFWNIQTRDPMMDNAVVKSTYGGIKKFFTENYSVNKKFVSGDQYIILATEENSIDNLKKIQINKRYDFDRNDDYKLKFAYTDYDQAGSTISSYTYKAESNHGDHYFYGKIETVENATYRDGLSFKTKEFNNYYDNGLASETLKYSNDANAPPIITSFEYYTNGNLKKQTLSATGITPQSTSYEYESTGRYVDKTITPDGLSTSSVIDTLGRVSEETSSLGLKTYYSYDEWGNIETITDYLGKITTISRVVANSPTGAVYSLSKKREGGTESIVTFDKFDREIQSKTQSINGKWIVLKTEYDLFGRKIKYSEPLFEGEAVQWNEITYDELNRPVENKSFTGKIIKTCYEGMKVTVEDGHKKTSKTLDAMGNTIRQQDHGGIIGFSYYPNGAVKETDYEGIKTTFEIDKWGNKSKITDPSAGVFTYEYDDFGRITREDNPKGHTIYTYDNLGRPQTESNYGKTSAENTSIVKTYTYNPTTQLPETITGTSNTQTFVYTTFYDQYYRISGKKEQTPEFTYTTNTTFDSFGRADVVSISTTVGSASLTSTSSIKNIYDGNGILIRQNNNATGAKVWQITDVTAQGQTKQMEYGNGYTINNNYRDSDNSLTNIQHVNDVTGISIVDIGYDYNMDRGILNSRNNRTFNKDEKYDYDKLNRLLKESVGNTVINEYTYDQRGRMTSNTDLGKYSYNQGDYKLQNIAFNTKGQSLNSQRGFATITYNAFKSPLQISLAGKDNLTFDYNILKTRYKMTSSSTGAVKLYSSDFAVEIIKKGGRTEIITYITGDPYSANYIKKTSKFKTITSEAYYYLHRDNVGSILAITDANNGSVIEQRYFDAWGNLKVLKDSEGQITTDDNVLRHVSLFIDRGYTGHEHLQTVGLINMNARLYDQVVRKFLSADNMVSDPFNTQAYDRYSYVLNNPLLNVDLDGNEITLGVAVVIAVGVAIFGKAIANMIQGIPFWYGMGKTAVMGAISGAISFGIGTVATTAFGEMVSVGKAAFEAGMHALSSGIMSQVDGGTFGSGFFSGLISSAISSGVQGLGTIKGANNLTFGGQNPGLLKAIMVTSGAFSGGISAAIAGGKFWKGFQQGLITSGLNHVAHMVAAKIEFNNKLDEALKQAGLTRNDPVTKETLAKLAMAFKELWGQSSQWAKWADDNSIAEWESNDGSTLRVGSDCKIYVNDDTKGSWGVTNAVGQMIFAPDLISSYNPIRNVLRLADTFLHELSHSIDSCNNIIGITPYDIGNDLLEIKAYKSAYDWTGLYNSSVTYYYRNVMSKMFLILNVP